MNGPSTPQEKNTNAGLSPWRLARLAALGVLAALAGAITARLIVGTPEDRGRAYIREGEVSKTELTAKKFILLAKPEPLPDLAFTGADGKPHRLSEWRGKTVLLNLWATWCAPCKTEMPSLDRLQARLGGGKFQVIALSTDIGGPEKPASFFKNEGIAHLEVYNDRTSEALKALNASGLPLSVALDKEGREIARLLGPADWDSPEATAQIEAFMNSGG
jgi:thiol-disulfide isomerase/thioredoxin